MDEIEKILQTTGLSCDELMKKLQCYKTVRINDNDEKSTLKTDKTCMETVIIQNNSNSTNHNSYNNHNNKKNNGSIKKNLQNGNEHQDEDSNNVNNTVSAQALDDCHEVEITTVNQCTNEDQDDDAKKSGNVRKIEKKSDNNVEMIINDSVSKNGDPDEGNDTNEDRDEGNDTNEDRDEGNNTSEDQDKGNDTSEDRDRNNDTNKDRDNGGTEQKIVDDNDVSNQNTEDLINNIKLQLSSLRNKKKTNCYISDFNKKINTFTKKHKRIAEIHPTIDFNEQNNDNNLSKDPLITTTEETNFLIVNVSGGVDLTQENNCEKSENLKRKPHEKDKPDLSDSNCSQVKKIRLSEPIVEDNKTTTPTTDDKSPFISDSLENFLNEKQLKISYAIPKLGAEDGLMETTKPSPYDYKNNNCNMRPRGCFMKKQPVKPIKARTLAEMRRQMERMKSAENSQENCEIQPKKNTILSRNSYVLYKNKKIWLPAIKQNHCVGTVEDYQTIMRRRKNIIDGNKNRKLSLLSAMFQQTKLPKISYKPGPLSKKIELQTKESCKYWKTELKKLPKIYFEVIPEINKPIDRRFLHLLPIFDDNIITKERADFALSVLKQPENKQQIFKFPIPYKNNQEQLAVCRPILYNNDRINANNCDKLKKDNSGDIGIVIKDILDDMIRYVETKEISDDLIRDDDIIYNNNDDNNNNNNNNKDNDNNKQKNFVKKKRKRIDAELQRLNCKIINLENDNNNLNDDQYCNKPYCKLGCICKSLQCEPILLNHCQRLDCMFNCKCPKKQENSLLDEYKMNHLNEQVKKNLAKVEREFTQTIIQQGNEMYVVGNTGDYKKMKRTSKAPKRYHDYEYDFNNKPTTQTATTIPKKSPEIDYNLKECRVDLIKLNLDNVVPLCLQHFHHNCYCGGFMIDNRSTINKTDDSSARIRPVYSKYRERHKHPIYKTKTFYKKKVIVDKLSDNINNHNNKNDEFETICITNDDIQPTTSNNNNTKFSKRKQAFVKIREDLDENSSISRRCSLNDKNDKSKIPSNSGYNRVFEGEIQVPLKQNLHMLNIIGNKNSHLEYLRILPWNSLIKGYNNNKIKIWCTLGRPYTLLCNKYYAVPPKNCISINKLTTLSPTPAVKNDIVKWILNNKLPPNRCAIKTFAILVPTKNHFSIAGLCERNSDEQEALTKSLLKTVSTTTTTTTTTTVNSTISVPAKVTSPPSSSSPSPPPPKTAQSAAFSSLLSSLSHTSSLLAITENRGMKWKHKDMNNEVQILFITNRHFALKLFYYNTNNNDNLEIALPKVAKTSKWYMIYLKSDFTYLLFKKCNYTIKYTDLLEFINMSKNLQKTIMIKNEKIVNNYLDVKKFGIYCVPQFQDRLFIGPFLNDEEHNIDTLRYINRQLFDTKIFQQIQGKSGNYNNPVWIYEWKQWYKPYTSTVKENINNSNDIIIISNTKLNDTTNNNSDNKGNDNDDDDDDDDVIILDDPIVPTEPSKTQSNISYDNVNGEVFMLPFVKELNSDDVKNRTANRFIITNIPHLGYLEAHQYETQIIDVFWPERIKAYRFINVKFAKYSLIHYFSQIFCPVNEDFKISVVILTEIDPNVNKPMDIKYIIDPGPFICGDFGVYSEETAPQEFLKAHKINSINQLLRLDQRVEESFDRLVQLFGLFLMTTSEQQQFKTTKEILDWAISEIYVMKRLSGNYEAEKTDLQYLRRFKFLKIKKMLLALPLDERKKHYDQIMAIKQSQRLPITNRASYVNRKKRINEMEITETIEIKDSDDEEDVHGDKIIEKNTEQVETNDGKTDKLKQLAKIGTVVQPVFQQVTNSGIIQKGGNTILNKSLLKNKFTPTRTYLIAKKINGDSFKIVNTRSEIVKNLDNSAKVVNNIITNVTKERA